MTVVLMQSQAKKKPLQICAAGCARRIGALLESIIREHLPALSLGSWPSSATCAQLLAETCLILGPLIACWCCSVQELLKLFYL